MPFDPDSVDHDKISDPSEPASRRAEQLVTVACNDPKSVNPVDAVELLDSPDEETRAYTAETLARIGAQQSSRIQPPIPRIAEHLTDENPDVRVYVLSTLAAVANVAPEEVEPSTDDLIALLKTTDGIGITP